MQPFEDVLWGLLQSESETAGGRGNEDSRDGNLTSSSCSNEPLCSSLPSQRKGTIRALFLGCHVREHSRKPCFTLTGLPLKEKESLEVPHLSWT